MADYKELLRRAIEALPENNGAARRAVYEKARSALVAQLRAIDPPLPAREITQHRLQLEDCIRQVEQEASEANITGLRSFDEPRPAPAPEAAPARAGVMPPPGMNFGAVPSPRVAGPTEPVNLAPAQPAADPFAPRRVEEEPAPTLIVPPAFEAPPEPEQEPEPIEELADPFASVMAEAEPEHQPEPEPGPEQSSIEDIIAASEQANVEPEPEPVSAPVIAFPGTSGDNAPDVRLDAEEPVEPAPAPLTFPTFTPRSEPFPPSPANSSEPVPNVPFEPVRRGPTFDIRRDGGLAAQQTSDNTVLSINPEPLIFGQSAALHKVAEPIAVLDQPLADTLANAPAMSAVREVDVEIGQDKDAREAQVTIERAIATLDREARGETSPIALEAAIGANGNVPPPLEGLRREPRRLGADPTPAASEPTFAQAPVDQERGGFNALTLFLVVFLVLLVGAGGGGYWAWREGYVDLNAMFGQSEPAVAENQPTEEQQALATDENATAPGNTATPEAAPATGELQPDARLTGDPTAPATAPTEDKSDERLPSITAATPETQIAPGQAPVLDSTATAGSQSLLLEAADNGGTGAVPFSGTIDWSRGEDETGSPTLVGKASIPARNLNVDLLLRRNTDPSLPASHLMEINFSVTDSFIGGSIAGLPGVLLKNEELVQGTPLVGASARVVGNSFLFALSASQTDEDANINLLTSRKWMDLAIVYATGKRAIITLEKDPAAETLFKDIFAAWGEAPAAAATP